MFYTTYFANIKKLPEHIIPISICGKAPAGYSGIEYKALAPRWSFFSEWQKNRDNHYYVSCFNQQVLDKLNIIKVVGDLVHLSQGKDVALVCYERPEDFCHRHLVANWFRENNIKIREWSP